MERFIQSSLKRLLPMRKRSFGAICLSIMFLPLILFSPMKAYPHGEDHPGPHGGKIHMPSAFHTELVVTKKRDKALFYLLDINFKTVSIKKSKLESKIFKPILNPTSESKKSVEQKENATIPLNCKKLKDHFECILPSSCLEPGSCNVRVFADVDGDQRNSGVAEYTF